MELVLWRHAEAEDGLPDLARRLTPKGEKQARRVAQWLGDRLPETARVLVSPAVRTQQTAQALVELGERKLRTVPALAPGATAAEFLQAVDWPNARQVVVAVGHQPTLGLVASTLLAGVEQPWAVKKGAAWWFSSRPEEDGSIVTLVAMINPGML